MNYWLTMVLRSILVLLEMKGLLRKPTLLENAGHHGLSTKRAITKNALAGKISKGAFVDLYANLKWGLGPKIVCHLRLSTCGKSETCIERPQYKIRSHRDSRGVEL